MSRRSMELLYKMFPGHLISDPDRMNLMTEKMFGLPNMVQQPTCLDV